MRFASASSRATVGALPGRLDRIAALGHSSRIRARAFGLGREALAEKPEWLLDHRHCPIEHQCLNLPCHQPNETPALPPSQSQSLCWFAAT
jgi:hypothetical protein